ncbi:hypothetical protein J4Q44_G00189800 [Coregonus suidteri]|uniref:Uncharacterized protein n=1 Tax=Coregonus suidteri TaxID=861788 RepID=A0AAN8QPD5_9TELE
MIHPMTASGVLMGKKYCGCLGFFLEWIQKQNSFACVSVTSTPAPVLDVAGLLTTGPGNPSLRTPGNHHYRHLLSIMRHTWTSSLPEILPHRMEAAANRDISKMVGEQGDLLCQHHDQLAMDEILCILQRLDLPQRTSPPTSRGSSTMS